MPVNFWNFERGSLLPARICEGIALIVAAAILAIGAASGQGSGKSGLGSSGGGTDDSLDPATPEHAAIMAAKPHIENPDFLLREDYWSGTLTPEKGKAIRLQLFNGNTYRMFLATGKAEADKGAKVHVQVVDGESTSVAKSDESEDGRVAQLELTPEQTGMYLVLMRAEAPGSETQPIPCVMFYGYE